MPEIVLTNLTKRWGKFYAVDDLNLVADDNSFVTLLGPSGCGKTTILRMIAGLETPTSGRITIGGVPVFDSEAGVSVPPNRRRVGFLFQNYALWPNMTVYQNIAFGLSNIKETMPKVDFKARRLAALIRALQKTGDIIRAVDESRDKSGGIDAERALVKLIDQFEISMQTAKTLMGYRLHETDDPRLAAKARIEELSAELEAAKAARAKEGAGLNEKFEITRGGEVQTALRRLTSEEIDLRVRRVARIVKIGMFMHRYPNELSGGQQQRVAIARTLAPEPAVLFMDEPLSNLDAKLRLEMRSELQRLHFETGSTFIYVTHDQMEAMTLSTKICLLDNGVLQQYDAPLDVYGRPVNMFAADFVGNPSINFIEAEGWQRGDGSIGLTVFGGTELVFTPDSPLDLPRWYAGADAEIAERAERGADKANKDSAFRYHIARVDEGEDYGSRAGLTEGDFVIGVRPEYVQLSEGGYIGGEIYSAMPTGMETTIKVRVGDFLLTGVVFGGVLYKIGERTNISFSDGGIALFSRKNGRIIALGSLAPAAR